MLQLVTIITLGCPKNTVDSEQIKGLLAKRGYSFTNNLDKAHIIIINTCGFIEDAKRESIETILDVLDFKKNGVCEVLLITGCLVQKYYQELSAELPEVDALIGTGYLPAIPDVLDSLQPDKRKSNKTIIKVGNPNNYLYDETLEQTSPVNGHYAYVKIAEGCDNSCTYCVIPAMRGRFRSRSIDRIKDEVENLVQKGVQEVILIAQDTTSYGLDLYGSLQLSTLLKELVKIENLRWIRLLYCYPDHITDELLTIISNEEKICSYLDLPLQHVSDSVLSAMGRTLRKNDILSLITRIRNTIPGVVLRSTFIVGFPGETETNFKELLEFLKEVKLERAGFFSYSQEPDTKAATLPDQIEEKVKADRLQNAILVQEEIMTFKLAESVGKVLTIIAEGPSADYEGLWEGRTEGDAPEIDSVVYFKPVNGILKGCFVRVKITHNQEYALLGEIHNESGK